MPTRERAVAGVLKKEKVGALKLEIERGEESRGF